MLFKNYSLAYNNKKDLFEKIYNEKSDNEIEYNIARAKIINIIKSHML